MKNEKRKNEKAILRLSETEMKTIYNLGLEEKEDKEL